MAQPVKLEHGAVTGYDPVPSSADFNPVQLVSNGTTSVQALALDTIGALNPVPVAHTKSRVAFYHTSKQGKTEDLAVFEKKS